MSCQSSRHATACELQRARRGQQTLELSQRSASGQQLFDQLDDRSFCYQTPQVSIKPGQPAKLLSAADEAEVRGPLGILAAQVNQLAADIGIAAEYQGGGSNRLLFFSDMLIRSTGQPIGARPAVTGVVEVKGSWQLELQPETQLDNALKDPDQLQRVLPAVQQVRLSSQPGILPSAVLLTY